MYKSIPDGFYIYDYVHNMNTETIVLFCLHRHSQINEVNNFVFIIKAVS